MTNTSLEFMENVMLSGLQKDPEKKEMTNHRQKHI